MKEAINEVKIQAKRLLKAIKTNGQIPSVAKKHLIGLPINNLEDFKLKHCLTLSARTLGFINWHHCQQILQGKERLSAQLDMGTIFHTSRCDVFINQWFSNYQEAKTIVSNHPNTDFLLPYKTQFVVVKIDYILELGITENSMHLLAEVEHDLYASYNSIAWDKLTTLILKKR